MRATAILLCVLPLLAQEQLPSKETPDKSATASVAGLVVRADTSEPIKKAKVSLWNEEGDHYDSRTDSEGRFQISNVPPGRYGLWASSYGYLGASYGAKLARRRVPVLLLEKGQELQDLLIRLQRPAAITGRVVNEEGEPVQEADISIQVYRGRGEKRRLSERQSVQTNDLGEYRIFDLEPGKYYLRATPPRDDGGIWNAARRGERPRRPEEDRERQPSTVYPPIFYPAATDASQATRIELKPGDEMRADFTFAPVQAFNVRGHVLGTLAKSSDPVVVVLASKSGRGQDQQAARVNSDGSYEIPDVVPGTYRLSISSAGDFFNPGLQTTVRTVDVTNADLDNVDLAPPAATKVELRGRLSIEGDSPPSLDRFNLFLAPAENDDNDKRFGSSRAQVNADGTFAFQQVSPGTYFIFASTRFSSRRGYYVKSLRFGARETVETGFTITEGSPPRLEVVLSSSTARIEGVVLDDKEAPVAGAEVLAVPRGSDPIRRNGFRVGSTDNRGGFVLANLRPGEYQLLAFDRGDENDYSYFSDTEFLEQHENASVRTQAQVGSTAKVKLKLTSLDDDRQQDPD